MQTAALLTGLTFEQHIASPRVPPLNLPSKTPDPFHTTIPTLRDSPPCATGRERERERQWATDTDGKSGKHDEHGVPHSVARWKSNTGLLFPSGGDLCVPRSVSVRWCWKPRSQTTSYQRWLSIRQDQTRRKPHWSNFFLCCHTVHHLVRRVQHAVYYVFVHSYSWNISSRP